MVTTTRVNGASNLERAYLHHATSSESAGAASVSVDRSNLVDILFYSLRPLLRSYVIYYLLAYLAFLFGLCYSRSANPQLLSALVETIEMALLDEFDVQIDPNSVGGPVS